MESLTSGTLAGTGSFRCEECGYVVNLAAADELPSCPGCGGASFARTVQQVNRIHFSDETDVIALSEIYEHLLKRVAADSAGYAGEFYTQRHIIRAMVEVVAPKLGDRIYDPGFGTAGFLGESADFIRRNGKTLGEAVCVYTSASR